MLDAALYLISLIGCLVYFKLISVYTHQLDAPVPLILLFMVLLISAIVTHIRLDQSRRGRVNVLAEVIVFVLAATLAIYLRSELVEVFLLLDSMDGKDVVLPIIGLNHDYTNLLSNRLVGYSGCLVVSLIFLRFTVYKFFKPYLYRIFILEQNRPQSCPACGRY